MTALRITDLRNPFVLNGIDFALQPGERFSIVGPSGAGKTTLLRAIAGLLQCSGDIYFNDRRMNDVAPEQREVGFVSPRAGLFSHMTLRENLAFPLLLRKRSHYEVNEEVSKAARRFEIDNVLEQRPSALSSGQAQRGALARALIFHPKVLLLDEPFSHLDPPLRANLLRLLYSEVQTTTTIHVSHDQEEAFAYCGRAAVMENGKLIQLDVPEQLYERPASLEVAQFLGPLPMNVLRGMGEQFGAPRAVVGIRANRVTIAADGMLEGIVRGTRFVGGVRLADVETRHGMICAQAFDRFDCNAAVRLRFEAAGVRLFDPDTGVAL